MGANEVLRAEAVEVSNQLISLASREVKAYSPDDDEELTGFQSINFPSE